MKNRKSTKYALVSSIIAIFLCTVMLIGTTFAWFTDEASTSVNTIQAGVLDLALLDDEGEDLEGETLEWIKAEGEAEVLWEPGCTYKLPTVNIVNKGNLALKYKVIINGIDGDAKLLEAIDFTVTLNDEEIDLADFEGDLLPEESEALKIEGHMDEEAGNEYQGLAIEGISITVKAAQLPYEYDSYDNQYDANAEYADSEDADEPEEPAEPEEDVFVPETWAFKFTDANDLSDDILLTKKTISGGNLFYHDKDAVLVSEKAGVNKITLGNFYAYNVKAVVYLAEGADAKEIIIDDGDFYFSGDAKLVMNYSGSPVKLIIKNGVTINNVAVTSAAQVAPYCVNVTDIAVI